MTENIFGGEKTVITEIKSHISQFFIIYDKSSDIYEIVKFIPEEDKIETLDRFDPKDLNNPLFSDIKDFTLFCVLGYIHKELLIKVGIEPLEVTEGPDNTVNIDMDVDSMDIFIEDINEEQGTRIQHKI